MGLNKGRWTTNICTVLYTTIGLAQLPQQKKNRKRRKGWLTLVGSAQVAAMARGSRAAPRRRRGAGQGRTGPAAGGTRLLGRVGRAGPHRPQRLRSNRSLTGSSTRAVAAG